MEFGLPELLILVLIVVLIYGERRLGEIGRGIGSAMRHRREESHDRQRRDR